MTTALDRSFVAAVAAASRTFADALDEALATHQAPTDSRSATPPMPEHSSHGQPVVTSDNLWDPLADPPWVTPRVKGTREEEDWCTLTYLSGIYAINKRFGRGADRDEVRKYAKKAGYRDARAVTAWSKGNGGTCNDDQMKRWVTEPGKDFFRRMADERGVQLPPDLLED